ncbi:MAG TPA: flagellar protein FlgN [Tepidimicrobium sp.]|nr:flagellar protein FlgN [Tepidimicrobium sp.]
MSFSEELTKVLKEQLNILKALELIAYDKTDIIVADDVEALEKMTREEEGYINRMATVEEERLRLLDSWGLNISTPISHIIDKVPDGREELIQLQDSLVEVLNSIQERNVLNQELIEDNLQWLNFNMNLISNTRTSATYGKDDGDKGVGNSLFDRKV